MGGSIKYLEERVANYKVKGSSITITPSPIVNIKEAVQEAMRYLGYGVNTQSALEVPEGWSVSLTFDGCYVVSPRGEGCQVVPSQTRGLHIRRFGNGISSTTHRVG